jgi:hypothetical protein
MRLNDLAPMVRQSKFRRCGPTSTTSTSVSIKHLLNAALADDPNDALIWDRVHHECTADGIDNASADRHQGCRFRHPLLAMVRERGEKLLVR